MNTTQSNLQLVIITGMSGAGKTVAIQCFEDLGYYCVDNLPPTLLTKFVELMKDSSDKVNKIAIVMDLRARDFFEMLPSSLDEVNHETWITPNILFLDAKDETLVTRYKETRRSHPLAPLEAPLVGIQKERDLLEEIRDRAQIIIDTSGMKPKHLREKIMKQYAAEGQESFNVHVMSFGFKHGIPLDADLVFDVRFLPNPFYVKELRPQTGMDAPVYDYVMKFDETTAFLDKLVDLIDFMLPQYKGEGKSQLVIAIGCTGGQHRSVSLARYLGEHFKTSYKTYTSHRDIEKRKDH